MKGGKRDIKKAKIGAIFLVSVMALAGASAGYALWFDYLHLDVSVETGYINAEWSVVQVYDNEIEGKDYSSIEAILFDDFRFESPTGALPQTNGWMWIYIYNAYPCITYTVDFDLHCTGSIPIHLEDITYNWNTMPDAAEVTFTDMDGNLIPFPLQLHPGDVYFGKMTFHFDNTLEQDMDLTHVICADLMYHQYNEQAP